MIRILILLTLSMHLYGEAGRTNLPNISMPTCEDVPGSEPPFFVSSNYQMGNLEFENFRDLENPDRRSAYIPKGSIVYSPPELQEVDGRVPVKVLSVNDELEETARGSIRSSFRGLFSTLRGRPRVEEGDVGYIATQSLEEAGGYTFYVSEDAPVYRSPKGTLLNGKKIRPKTYPDGTYQMRKCCFDLANHPAPVCFEFHLYDVFDGENNLIETAALKGLGCGFFGDLDAVPNQLDNSMGEIYNLINSNPSEALSELGIGEMELFRLQNQYKGRNGNIPLIKLPVNQTTGFGPFNMRHYSPDDDAYSDNFIHPMSGCAFLRVAQMWESQCSGVGCELQYGNLFHREDWRVHETHDSGFCIDMRPFRSDDDRDEGLTFRSRRYDRERTTDFIKLLMKAGASDIVYGDNAVLNTVNSTETREEVLPDVSSTYWKYRFRPRDDSSGRHDNHIHFCFNSDDAIVQNTCDDGLLQREPAQDDRPVTIPPSTRWATSGTE